MTNEEAKSFLQSRIDIIDKYYPQVEDYREALDLAIKALEQEPNYLKKRDGNYVHYNVEWLLKNWQMELDILSDGKIKPCEDCISRQAVLDIIYFEDEWLYDAKSHNADTKIVFSGLESRVKDLPSVTPKTEWIPVSERLPEPSGHHSYLVTDAHFNPEYKARFVEVCEYEARDGDVPYWVGYCGDNPARVVAWMPLPEPYKAEESEENECK